MVHGRATAHGLSHTRGITSQFFVSIFSCETFTFRFVLITRFLANPVFGPITVCFAFRSAQKSLAKSKSCTVVPLLPKEKLEQLNAVAHQIRENIDQISEDEDNENTVSVFGAHAGLVKVTISISAPIIRCILGRSWLKAALSLIAWRCSRATAKIIGANECPRPRPQTTSSGKVLFP